MSKKMFKRSLALGALMAFVITGSAMAGNVTPTVNGDTVIWEDINVAGYPTKADTANKPSDAGVSFEGKSVVISSDADDPKGTLGLWVANSNDFAGVKDIKIKSEEYKTGLVIGGNVEIGAPITLSGTGDARIEVFADNSIKLDVLNVDCEKGKLQLNDNAKATVGTINVISGALGLQSCNVTPDYANDQVEYTLGTVNLAEGTKINAVVPTGISDWNIHAPSNPPDMNPSVVIKGDITINLGKDAVADFGAVGHDEWRPGKTNFQANSLTVNVTEVTDKTAVYFVKDKVTTSADKIKVIGAAENNSGDAVKDLDKLANVIKINERIEYEDAFNSDIEVTDNVSAATGVNLEQKASSIYDGAEGTVQADGTAKVEKIIKNSNTYGITENNALSLMTWRAEMNDMNKRMGELRNAEGQHGVWVRMVRGEAEYESVKNQYNQYQIGYDEKLSTDPSWTVGAAFNYTEGDTSYSTGSAENKNVGFSVYGSKLNADGSFVDLIAKYARLENDFDVLYDGNLCSGDYASNGYSISAEYGKRFTKENGLWIEPQVELTYGKVGSADYKLGTVDIAQDSIESLVGRVGFSLGKNISKGNVYARASYLYDFEGETSVKFTDGGEPRVMEQDLGGGWWEVGVGANINLSKATYIYADVEKTFGGEVDTNWQWNLGVRYSF